MEKSSGLQKREMETNCNFYNERVIHTSFGGLMMVLKGNVQHLKAINNDQRIYILIKSV